MLQIRLLGQFDVRIDGKRAVIGSRAAQSLLAFLALNSGVPQRREKLAGMLWPDMSDENARSNLRHELWRVRKALTSPKSLSSPQSKSPRADYIVAEELTITFNPDAEYWLDAAQLERAEDNLQSLVSNLTLYQGELLPGFYDDWVLLERERVQAVFETRMRALLEHLIVGKHWATAVTWAEKWIALGQTPEAAYRALMLTYAMLGDRAQCVAAYERCKQTLEQELGVEPSEETRALYQELLRGDTIASVSLSAPRVLVGMKSALYDEPPAPGEAPFKGLPCFDEGDAELFFGREELTAKLVARLRQLPPPSEGEGAEGRFLAVVVGASGSGKSSLVRAGMIPALRTGNAGKEWRIHVITPTAHPLLALATELTRDVESVTATATLLDDLAREPRALFLFLRRPTADSRWQIAESKTPSAISHSLSAIRHTLLVIDQFEELFTLCRDELEREQFIDNLLYAISQSPVVSGQSSAVSHQSSVASGQSSVSNLQSPSLTLVLAIRADFYAHLAQYPELRDAVAQHQEYIGPMTVEELRRAIEEPAKRRVAADGEPWEFEPGLVDLMLRDVGDEPGALPLLSHALLETWKRRSGHTLTLKGYHEAGGVRGAIAQTAETTYQRLTSEQQEVARNIFLRLTELGEGTEDTRRRASFDELVPRGEEAGQVRAVLTKLADARLVTTGADSAEVAHEALIREWDRLREWLNQDREGLRLHRHLTEAAREWELLERDAGAVYRGARLAQANEWCQTNGAGFAPRITELERAFLEACKENEKREAREREEQQQRELLAKEKLLEAERLRVAQERAANRRLRQRALWLAGAFVLAIVLAVIALLLGDQARSSALAAQQQQRLANARELAASAISNLSEDPERSILLATQAVSTTYAIDRTWTTEAEDALRRALEASRVELTLRGHTNWIWAVAFSPDGMRVATASDDGTAKVWDAATGRLLFTVSTNATAEEQGIAFSPDGTRLATVGAFGTAKVWDANTGVEQLTLRGHTGWVTRIKFSPDGERLATGSIDGSARIWDAFTGQELFFLRRHTGEVWDVDFSPDGTRLATAGGDGKAKVWDAASGNELLTLVGHLTHVRGVRFSPDGSRLATASQDRTARIWDAVTGNELLTLEAPADLLTQVAFSPDGKRLAASSSDGKVRVWDTRTGSELFTLSGHTGSVWDVAFSPDGSRLATASWDGTAKVWNASYSRELFTFSIFDALATFPSGDEFSSRLPDEVEPFLETNPGIFSPDGIRLVTGLKNGTVKLWDVSDPASLKELLTLRGHTGAINSAGFSPDGTRLATASQDRTAKVWDVATGKELLTLRGHTAGVLRVAFSPDGTRLATTSTNYTAKVWDVSALLNTSVSAGLDTATIGRTEQPLFTLDLTRSWSFVIGFSPDGKRLAAGLSNGTTRVWDAATGKELLTLRGHTGQIWSIAFSPDGTRLATASNDRTAKVWDAATGRELLTLEGHQGAVEDIAFNPDGTRLVSGSSDGTVRVWDAASGRELASLPGHTDAVAGVSFSADGQRILTSSHGGMIRVYLSRIEDLIRLARTRVTRDLTNVECQQYLHRSKEQCPQDTALLIRTPAETLTIAAVQPTGSKGKVCEVTDFQGVNDNWFNQSAYVGVQESARRFGWRSALLESREQADYKKNIDEFLQSNCDLIVAASGFYLADEVKTAATAHPNQKFIIMDLEYDPPLDNVWAEVYAPDQAAFLAGYVAASVSKTGKVGTFGGINIPPVSDFMDGLALGVAYYNDKNGAHVQVLGWDVAKHDGLFTGNFVDTEDGYRMSELLMNQGADVILPVAGEQGLGAAAAVKERGNAYLIGVDTDWAAWLPEFRDLILTSIEKRLDVSVVSAVQAIDEGTFTGGTHVGTLENGGVSIAPFHALDALVSPQVKADLEQIEADIIAGKLKTKP